MRIRRFGIALSTALALALAAATFAVDAPNAAAARSVNNLLRVSDAPNVQYPVDYAKARDLKLFGKRPGTEIVAPCGTTVRAVHPGTVHTRNSSGSGPNLVYVESSEGKIVTWYGYMQSKSVHDGMIVSSGQPLGEVGQEGVAKRCSLYLSITWGVNGHKISPTWWLNKWVGQPLPTPSVFGNWGFTLASFNMLGASHTLGKRKPYYKEYAERTRKQIRVIDSYGADVVGLQEFQGRQQRVFANNTNAYGKFGDRDNYIIWRKSTMKFLGGHLLDVPYFNGNIRKMPVVHLQDRASGRSAYFINVHNPASTKRFGNQYKWRTGALEAERNEIIRLRATGKAVFLTGDLNERKRAFCTLTAGKLTLSADSIPTTTCETPENMWIDWIFAAGPARFSSYERDWTVKHKQRISDHPIVVTQAHLAPE